MAEKENIFRKIRDEKWLSREEVCNFAKGISPERLERIERIDSEFKIHSDEVVELARVYNEPTLSHWYCYNECPIGNKYASPITTIGTKELSQLVLETIASVNALHNKQDRLIEISVDGKIENNELDDFIKIQDELKKISVTITSMKAWAEQKLNDGSIDKVEYEYRKSLKK